MHCVGVRYVFSASHVIADHPGKCRNLHGHNYVVELEVCRDSLDSLGMVIDFGVVKQILREVAGMLDHAHLNDVLGLRNATCELIAMHIRKAVSERLGSGYAVRVKVYETPDSWCIDG
ncbi:MAG: 6-carboxytetrahydropterin synthase QueD [Candidatus Nezhaarchaeales archaeon]